MSFANLIKQLKKQLKSGKRRLTLGLIVLIIGVVSIGVSQISQMNHMNALAAWTAPEKESQKVLKQIQKSRSSYLVFARKNYICGQEITELGKLNPDQVLQFYKEHPQDQVSLTNEGEVYFVEQVEDLSAECKHNAFFGLDKEGRLSLFAGLPDKKQIIRTFFQLNVEHLKTSLPQGTFNQLMQGIAVTDLAEYNSVLSTFSDYAVEVNGRS
jgi:forespore regulator of the sigma-K checkpoint